MISNVAKRAATATQSDKRISDNDDTPVSTSGPLAEERKGDQPYSDSHSCGRGEKVFRKIISIIPEVEENCGRPADKQERSTDRGDPESCTGQGA